MIALSMEQKAGQCPSSHQALQKELIAKEEEAGGQVSYLGAEQLSSLLLSVQEMYHFICALLIECYIY